MMGITHCVKCVALFVLAVVTVGFDLICIQLAFSPLGGGFGGGMGSGGMGHMGTGLGTRKFTRPFYSLLTVYTGNHVKAGLSIAP